MQTAKSFKDILALRGRVVIFTASAAIGLRFEQCAERNHAAVVATRGWADFTIPLGQWSAVHRNREYGVLSCDQRTFVTGFRLPATDLVWVGDIGDPVNCDWRWASVQQAMARAAHLENEGQIVRKWLIAEDAL